MLHATLSLVGAAVALLVASLWAGTLLTWALMLVAMILIFDGVTLLWSGIVSAIAFKLVDLTIGLRVNEEQEREGLDTVTHGERAYNG